ncbi:MAG: dienelactone hydrolase family protein [Bacteroidota bacterium]
MTNNSIYLRDKEANLTYLIRRPLIETIDPPVIFLLHGTGSNEQDLFSFAENLPASFLVISVRAPFTNSPDSYSWYHVDFSTGKPVINRKQADKSRNILLQFIAHMQQEYHFDSRKVYLCGFSQGGIMAYSTGLTKPEFIKGIAILSGRILEEARSFFASDEKLSHLSVFVAHGTEDNILPVQYAREGLEYMQKRNITPTYKEYPAGHEISSDMFSDLLTWLNKNQEDLAPTSVIL